MKKQSFCRKSFLFFLILAIAAITCCSKYQSFDETATGAKIINQNNWQVDLPWESGKDLTIDLSLKNKILIYGREGNFHIGMIPLDTLGKPQKTKHLELEYGNTLQVLDDGRLLIIEQTDYDVFVTIANQDNLTKQLSTSFVYSTTFDKESQEELININNWRQVKDFLIFYHNEIKILKHSWMSTNYFYTIPMVTSARYDIFLINLKTLQTTSYKDIKPDRLNPLNEIIAKGMSNVLNKQRLWELQSTMPGTEKISSTDSFIYLLNEFFIVDNQRSFIFSLENLKGDKLYFYQSILNKKEPPLWGLSRDFALLFPFELTVTYTDPNEQAEKMKAKDIELKHDDKLLSYKTDQIKFCRGGFILAGHLKLAQDLYSEFHTIAGCKLDYGLYVQMWDYRANNEYDFENLIMDPLEAHVYFPDTGPDDMYHIVGLSTTNGKKIQGFPANFLVADYGDKTILRLVGTAVDFTRGLVYLHSFEQNKIICAKVNLNRDVAAL